MKTVSFRKTFSLETKCCFCKCLRNVQFLKATNDNTVEALSTIKDFHGLTTLEVENKRFLLHFVQKYESLCPSSKRETLKKIQINFDRQRSSKCKYNFPCLRFIVHLFTLITLHVKGVKEAANKQIGPQSAQESFRLNG